jgi:hypothetical protein
MIGTDHRVLIWIRLQCFLLSKHDGAKLSPRNLSLLMVDEYTPPFSCKDIGQIDRESNLLHHFISA